jgi:hypothetical protein
MKLPRQQTRTSAITDENEKPVLIKYCELLVFYAISVVIGIEGFQTVIGGYIQ